MTGGVGGGRGGSELYFKVNGRINPFAPLGGCGKKRVQNTDRALSSPLSFVIASSVTDISGYVYKLLAGTVTGSYIEG